MKFFIIFLILLSTNLLYASKKSIFKTGIVNASFAQTVLSREIFKFYSKNDYKNAIKFLDKIFLEKVYFDYNLGLGLERKGLIKDAIDAYLQTYNILNKYRVDFPLYNSLKERIAIGYKKIGDIKNYEKYSSSLNINSNLEPIYLKEHTKLFQDLLVSFLDGTNKMEKANKLKEEALKAIYFKAYLYLFLDKREKAFHILKELSNGGYFIYDLLAILYEITLDKNIYDKLSLYDINISDSKFITTTLKGNADKLDTYAMKLLPISYKRNEIDCNSIPKKNLMVAIAYGQSNSANRKAKNEEYIKVKTKNVYEFYNGKCYRAKNPLLGADGVAGNSVWTLLGDKVVESGLYDNVIFSAFGRGTSSIADWKNGGKYNKVLKKSIIDLKKFTFTPTHILWHQGETDAMNNTSTKEYKSNFLDMLNTIREEEITAPIYVSVASICRNEGSIEIQNAQKELINHKLNIFSGPNTDALDFKLRYDDCHFNNKGKEKVAKLWFEKIKFYYNK